MTSKTIALAAAAALLWSSAASAQCTKDTDCHGDRICQQGSCVSPAAPPPRVSAPPPRETSAPVDLGSRRLALKVHPLTILGGIIVGASTGVTLLSLPVELEYALAPNVSVFGQVAPLVVTSPIGTAAGLVLGGGVRFYPFAEALRGLWMGGLVVGGASGSGLSYDLQAQAGWAWVFDSGFYLSVGGSLSLAALLTPGAIPVGLLVPIGFTF